jgi:branched-chain amino acid transport system permease protein/neutral amino acid transport system permease protein
VSIFVASLGFGLVISAILALAALGFTLQAGMTNVVNLAYGDMMTAGAFAALVGQSTLHLSLWPALVFGSVIVALLSFAMNRLIIGPFVRRGTKSFQMILVTFALGIILEYAIVMKWGEDFYAYKGLSLSLFRWGSFELSYEQLTIVIISVVLLTGFHFVVRYSRLGRALRAMADDKQLARACGVNVARLTDIVWLISGALAGISGVALAISAGSFNEIVGANFLLVVVAAAILGGAGEPNGAMVGAVVVGFAMEVSTVWIPGSYSEAVALILLIVGVLVRPQGLIAGRGKWVLAQ